MRIDLGKADIQCNGQAASGQSQEASAGAQALGTFAVAIPGTLVGRHI